MPITLSSSGSTPRRRSARSGGRQRARRAPSARRFAERPPGKRPGNRKGTMNVKEIKELVELVSRRGLAGLEIERAGFRLRIEGAPAQRAAPVFTQALADSATPEAPALPPAAPAAAVAQHPLVKPCWRNHRAARLVSVALRLKRSAYCSGVSHL